MSDRRSHKLIWSTLCLGAVLLLACLGVSYVPSLPDPFMQLTQFLGRFHPLILHVPIGLYVGLVLVELIGCFKRSEGIRLAAKGLLVLTTCTAVLAACLGLLLYASGDYSGDAAYWHKWLGLGFAAGCLLLMGVGLQLRNGCATLWKILYGPMLVGVLILMSVAGHYGGSLTHGSSYLTEYAPDWLKPLMGEPAERSEGAGVSEVDLYRDTVDPVLQEYCVSCHGPEKQKSDYRVDTYAHMMVPGRSGETPIVPFEAHGSYLVQLLWMHESDEMAMPPEGKARPRAEDILAVSHWVSLGAEGPKEDAAEREAREEAEAERKAALDELGQQGVVVLPQALDQPTLYVDFLNVEQELNDQAWASITYLKDHISELKFAAVPVASNHWSSLSGARVLTDVNLSGQSNVQHAVAMLNSLPALKRLNLHGSDLTAGALKTLNVAPLSELYLGGTPLSDEAIEAVRAAHPKVTIVGNPDMAEVDAIEAVTKRPLKK